MLMAVLCKSNTLRSTINNFVWGVWFIADTAHMSRAPHRQQLSYLRPVECSCTPRKMHENFGV